MDAQELYKLFRSRQSDRHYDTTRAIPREVLQRIAENALLAPSATNQQPWQIVVVDTPDLSQKVASAARSGMLGQNKFLLQAPVHILIVGDRPGALAATMGKTFRDINYVPYDLGILIAHLVLAVEAEGLGSCIVGWLNGRKVAKVLGIPKTKKVLFDISVGYSLDSKRPKKRKKPEDCIHYNGW